MASAEASGGGMVASTREYLDGVQHELKRVTWPTRPELTKATRMIIILTFVLGIVIGLVDWLLQMIFVRGLAALVQ